MHIADPDILESVKITLSETETMYDNSFIIKTSN